MYRYGRHIRLKKGFKNEEVMDGVVKLRIPDVLLKEKIRTQSRFDVSLPQHSQHILRLQTQERCPSPRRRCARGS